MLCLFCCVLQNEYKQDYNEWYKGLGWSPAGSLDVEKSRKATDIASDRKYRQHPSIFPFIKQTDSMDMMLAKHNADVMNRVSGYDENNPQLENNLFKGHFVIPCHHLCPTLFFREK